MWLNSQVPPLVCGLTANGQINDESTLLHTLLCYTTLHNTQHNTQPPPLLHNTLLHNTFIHSMKFFCSKYGFLLFAVAPLKKREVAALWLELFYLCVLAYFCICVCVSNTHCVFVYLSVYLCIFMYVCIWVIHTVFFVYLSVYLCILMYVCRVKTKLAAATEVAE